MNIREKIVTDDSFSMKVLGCCFLVIFFGTILLAPTPNYLILAVLLCWGFACLFLVWLCAPWMFYAVIVLVCVCHLMVYLRPYVQNMIW